MALKDILIFLLSSSVIGTLVTQILTARRANKVHKLLKLEELYVSVHNHNITIAEYYTRAAVFLLIPEPTNNEEEAAVKEQHDKLEVYHHEMRVDEKAAGVIPMIINGYFPELLPMWKEWESIRAELTMENKKAIMIDKKKREAMSLLERETICMEVVRWTPIFGQRSL